MKYSIIIPTCEKNVETIQVLINSIFKYTTIKENYYELIIVANGCSSEVLNYLKNNKEIRLLVYNEKIGYTRAILEGIEISKGEYLILLNDDIVFVEHQKDQWINRLEEGFKEDSLVGISGVHQLKIPFYEQWVFSLFFCVMIKRNIYEEIGGIDINYNPGYGEDIDFCFRLQKKGYKIYLADKDLRLDEKSNLYVGTFPLYHLGEKTVHQLSNWNYIIKRNLKYFYHKNINYTKFGIIIPTFNHLDDLKLCLESILKYTDLNDKKIVVVANGCTDNTIDYIDSLNHQNILYLEYPQPLGYAGSVNRGLNIINSEFSILLNNDCQILPCKKDEWIQLLYEPFQDEKVMICGPHKTYCPYAKRDLIIFHTVMIKNEIFDKI